MFTSEEHALLRAALLDYATILHQQAGLRVVHTDVKHAACLLRGALSVNDLDIALEVEALADKLPRGEVAF